MKNTFTIHDFDRRFQMEEQAKVPIDKTFRWEMILEDNIMTKRIYTAESVTSGHPDKLADLIADSMRDLILYGRNAGNKYLSLAFECGIRLI